jgi:deazaflavin-dependent oxidoreductase (nitroreductase family)
MMVPMNGTLQRGLRQLTKVIRPLALRSAGKQGSSTSVVRHVGRKTGRPYETPVVAVNHNGSVYIALPYGERTDWLKNVLVSGSATVMSGGDRYDVDRPEVIPMAEATEFFGAKEQRLQRRFGVKTCLLLHRIA